MAIEIDGGVPATTLNGSITSSDLSIVLAAGTGYPDGASGDPFYIVIDKGLSSQEVVECASRSGATITVTSTSERGVDGSSAAAHSSGAAVELVVPALELQRLSTHASATTGTPHGTAYLTPTAHTAIEHTTAMLLDDAVTTAKILDANVTTAKILDANVTTAKLADANVTTAKLADGAVTPTKMTVTSTSWTPGLLTASGAATLASAVGKYVNLGGLVTAWADISVTSSPTSGSTVDLTGLPGTIAGSNGDLIGGLLTHYNASTTTTTHYFMRRASSTSVQIFDNANTALTNDGNGGSQIQLASGDRITATLHYFD